jgi:hypothetical protein
MVILEITFNKLSNMKSPVKMPFLIKMNISDQMFKMKIIKI